jgi:hypothetical protein
MVVYIDNFNKSTNAAIFQESNVLQPIEDMFGVRGTEVNETTYPGFRRKLFLYLLQLPDGTDRRFTFFDHIRSPESWITDPRSLDAHGVFVPQPTQLHAPIAPVLHIDQNASQALRAVLVQEHSAQVKDFVEKKQQYKEHVTLIRMVKTLLCNE